MVYEFNQNYQKIEIVGLIYFLNELKFALEEWANLNVKTMTRGPFKKEELDNIRNDTISKNQYKFNILFLWMS